MLASAAPFPTEMDDYFRLLYGPAPRYEALTRRLWNYQRQANPVIARFSERLGLEAPASLPIRFFKDFALRCGDWEAEAVFESSGTSGQQPSRHLVRSLGQYAQNVMHGYAHFFPPGPRRILALLPSYLERGRSSLVQMVKIWMDRFGLPSSGFYLYDFKALRQAILEAGEAGEPVLLIGVAYALLDFAEEMPFPLPPDSIVMETGGMKGRREELVREELHERLCRALGIGQVASEYGMTELMSQAYSLGGGIFRPAPTLRVRVSDLHLDRLDQPPGVSGRLHFCDLANAWTCAFIASDDLGRMHEDGSFEVLGRIDNSELRGCNLMYVS